MSDLVNANIIKQKAENSYVVQGRESELAFRLRQEMILVAQNDQALLIAD